MQESNLKNMIILKNLPSNLVEEAIVILKQNAKVKNLEKIEKNSNKGSGSIQSQKTDYIVKEAKMLVEEYICKIENNQKKEKIKKEKINKYIALKRYAWIATIIIFIQAIIIIL